QCYTRAAVSAFRARGGRSSCGRVCPPRQDVGSSRDRHAGSRQFHGQCGAALSRCLSARHDEAGRSLHHQRSVAHLRPFARHHGGDAELLSRSSGRIVRQYHPCGRYLRGVAWGGGGGGVWEGGLWIPIMPLAGGGGMNEDCLRFVRANVREPLQVEGDIYACAACNDEGSRRLLDMMDEFEIANLDRLGETIIDASREATLERIRGLPNGTYRNSLIMDGYDKPLTLNAALTISDDGIHVDYAGTSAASAYGINVVFNYCLAYTAFGVKCLVAPDVPNNAGSLEPITVSAPEGCVLNAKRPWPVAARHTVGQMLPDVVAGCLQQAIAGGVPAEGASSLWNPQIFGGGSLVDEVEEGTDANTLPEFSTVIFHCGGAGARPQKDGLSATAFPSGVRTIPVEATESAAPIVFYRREFRGGSGGPGQFRGGLGQVIELG